MAKNVAQEQLVENATVKIPVTVRIIPPKHQGAPFSYIINVKDRKIQLYVSAKGKFILFSSPLLCHVAFQKTLLLSRFPDNGDRSGSKEIL